MTFRLQQDSCRPMSDAPTKNVQVFPGSGRALEHRVADEAVAARARDLLAPLPVRVDGTLQRPHLRRRGAEITGAT